MRARRFKIWCRKPHITPHLSILSNFFKNLHSKPSQPALYPLHKNARPEERFNCKLIWVCYTFIRLECELCEWKIMEIYIIKCFFFILSYRWCYIFLVITTLSEFSQKKSFVIRKKNWINRMEWNCDITRLWWIFFFQNINKQSHKKYEKWRKKWEKRPPKKKSLKRLLRPPAQLCSALYCVSLKLKREWFTSEISDYNEMVNISIFFDLALWQENFDFSFVCMREKHGFRRYQLHSPAKIFEDFPFISFHLLSVCRSVSCH